MQPGRISVDKNLLLPLCFRIFCNAHGNSTSWWPFLHNRLALWYLCDSWGRGELKLSPLSAGMWYWRQVCSYCLDSCPWPNMFVLARVTIHLTAMCLCSADWSTSFSWHLNPALSIHWGAHRQFCCGNYLTGCWLVCFGTVSTPCKPKHFHVCVFLKWFFFNHCRANGINIQSEEQHWKYFIINCSHQNSSAWQNSPSWGGNFSY